MTCRTRGLTVLNSAQTERNRTEDIYGNRYDQRSGSWGLYDDAVSEEERIINGWLTKERCAVELEILNRKGKPGPKYRYPPSLILHMLMCREEDGKPYRKCPEKCRPYLDHLGVETPCYKTVHNSAGKFFVGNLGREVIGKATDILRGRGFHEVLDPLMFIGTGSYPEYSAPQKIPVCSRDVEEQGLKDAEAADMRRMMEVFVSRNYAGGIREAEGALDGSGVGISGNGIYMEHIWMVNQRNFIKQHVMVDVNSQQIVSFSVTMEQPADARMMGPMMRGTVSAGVALVKLTVDSAYDTNANWEAASVSGTEFVPNLKKDFVRDRELVSRHTLRMMEERLGKSLCHRVTGYTVRWLVEVFFSVIKRMYGDRLTARRFDRMVLSMRIRYLLYTIHRTAILRRIDPRGGWTYV